MAVDNLLKPSGATDSGERDAEGEEDSIHCWIDEIEREEKEARGNGEAVEELQLDSDGIPIVPSTGVETLRGVEDGRDPPLEKTPEAYKPTNNARSTSTPYASNPVEDWNDRTIQDSSNASMTGSMASCSTTKTSKSSRRGSRGGKTKKKKASER